MLTLISLSAAAATTTAAKNIGPVCISNPTFNKRLTRYDVPSGFGRQLQVFARVIFDTRAAETEMCFHAPAANDVRNTFYLPDSTLVIYNYRAITFKRLRASLNNYSASYVQCKKRQPLQIRPSVRLSLCLSHAGTVSKRRKLHDHAFSPADSSIVFREVRCI